VEQGRKSPKKTLWAYAYEIVPPQVEGQMEAIRALPPVAIGDPLPPAPTA
jgi:hypothetical protein